MDTTLSTFFPSGEDGWQVGSRFEDNWAQFAPILRKYWAVSFHPKCASQISALCVTLEGRNTVPTGRTLSCGTRLPDDTIFLSGTDERFENRGGSVRQRAAAIARRDGLYRRCRIAHLSKRSRPNLWLQRCQRSVGHRWTKAHQNVEALKSGQDLLLVPVRDPDHRHEIRVSPLGQEQKVLILRDVTQRLDQEERAAAMQASLARAEQQEQLGRMASGIAHDFNNLLSAITGSAALISMGNDLSEDTQAHADRITRGFCCSAP